MSLADSLPNRKWVWTKQKLVAKNGNMSTTSKKHQNFVSEPMGEKPVFELAGIGDVLGGRLVEKDYDKAYSVLGQFLLFKKNEDFFKDWLFNTCGANAKQQNDCYQCLKQWCDSFL